jgi:hypothetical protein
MDKHHEKVLANNILEFLIDPTKFPVQQRLYFRPEEILRNEFYEDAKADSFKAYGDEKKNSDFYPGKNRSENSNGPSREATIMERKDVIASMDILSQHFTDENDPIAKDLRTMALAISKMANEEYESRLASDIEAKKKVEMIKCPTCQGNVMKQTGYCLHCKKKISDMKEAEASVVSDLWTKEAAQAVQQALVSDVVGGYDAGEEKEEEVPAPKKDEKDAFIMTQGPTPGGRMEKPSLSPGGGKIETIYDSLSDQTKKLIERTPELKKVFKKADDAPAPAPLPKEAPEKEETPVEPAEKESKKEEKVPEEMEKDVQAKVVKAEETPAEEKAEKEETPKKATDPKKIVDTNILAYDGIELEAGMQEAGEMTAEEQDRLNQLFQ